MNPSLTVLGAVVLATLVLSALSLKWCLPVGRTSGVILLSIIAGLLVGLKLSTGGAPLVLVVGAVGATQLLVYVGVIAWMFYRDPERRIPSEPSVILSPADGTVIYIRKLEAGEPLRSEKNGAVMVLDEFSGTELATQPLWQIGISMVFTDVHVNRSPIAGRVLLLKHRPGQFLSLRRQDALNLNERQSIVIAGDGMQVGLVQIASRLVRQIVAYVKTGEDLPLGHRVGMIRFGSQVDLFLPLARVPHLDLAIGDRLTAGETILCRTVAAAQPSVAVRAQG
jgi:phosphatidylserine decarboxylase